MSVDFFTQSLRDVLYAVAFGITTGAMIYLLCLIAGTVHKQPRQRPWDWAKDGECTNQSHPRVLP